MAKKSTSGRKAGEEANITAADSSPELSRTPGAETNALSADETPPSKTKAKATEDPAATGSVGISDIRKAVAFSNSVGGLDKAIALLQILKVAKEVQ